MSGLTKSSIARKVVMALSGLFLVLFLGQHFTINITSVIAPDTFNEWSHFMGYNPLVQYRWRYCTFCNGFCIGDPKQQG